MEQDQRHALMRLGPKKGPLNNSYMANPEQSYYVKNWPIGVASSQIRVPFCNCPLRKHPTEVTIYLKGRRCSCTSIIHSTFFEDTQIPKWCGWRYARGFKTPPGQTREILLQSGTPGGACVSCRDKSAGLRQDQSSRTSYSTNTRVHTILRHARRQMLRTLQHQHRRAGHRHTFAESGFRGTP